MEAPNVDSVSRNEFQNPWYLRHSLLRIWILLCLAVGALSAVLGWLSISALCLLALTAELSLYWLKRHFKYDRTQGEIIRLERRFPGHLIARNRRWPDGAWLKKTLTEEEVVHVKANFDQANYIEIPALQRRIDFRYQTDSLGRRLTSDSHEKNADRPVIAVFGCSCSFGQAVNTEDTFCWKLQEQFPEYMLANYGVPGFSAFECLLLMRMAVRRDKPAAVVYAYHPVVDGRNTGQLPEMDWFEGPRCLSVRSANGKRKLKLLPPSYAYRLALQLPALFSGIAVGILQSKWLKRNKPEYIEHTMRHVLLEMKKFCEEQETPFMVAAIDAMNGHQEFLNTNGFSWVQSEISTSAFDEKGISQWTMYPLDSHPSPAAHEKYAETIATGLETILSGGRAVPPLDSFTRKTEREEIDQAAAQFIYPLF